MKIIHCSDIHLDSALGHNFSTAQAKARNAELCATFSRMVQFAVREDVGAVLIAGDLFDGSYATVQTVDFVLDQIRSAWNVTFFYLRGNHDGSRHRNRTFRGGGNRPDDGRQQRAPCGKKCGTNGRRNRQKDGAYREKNEISGKTAPRGGSVFCRLSFFKSGCFFGGMML